MDDRGEEGQTITPTDEHHDWVTSVCGIDPRSYSAAPGEANSSGVVTIPEVTITGSPSPPEGPGDGTITLPEVTVTGSPDPTSSSDAAAAPTTVPVVAAAAVPMLTPGAPGPGGVPFDPSIVDSQPWSPIQGSGSAATTGAEAATTGAEAATTGAEVATTGAEVATTGAEVATTGAEVAETVAIAAEATAPLDFIPGPGWLIAGGIILTVAIGAGIWYLMKDDKPVRQASPQEVEQAKANEGKPIPTAQDPNTGQPLYTPGDGEYTPAIDPVTGEPFKAPGPSADPAADPSTPDPAQAPGANTPERAQAATVRPQDYDQDPDDDEAQPNVQPINRGAPKENLDKWARYFNLPRETWPDFGNWVKSTHGSGEIWEIIGRQRDPDGPEHPHFEDMTDEERNAMLDAFLKFLGYDPR